MLKASGPINFHPTVPQFTGVYSNEIRRQYAKRSWEKELGSNFLLDRGHDYELVKYEGCGYYKLLCDFKTACGRYAYWRLTNDKAPDSLAIIAAAHVA